MIVRPPHPGASVCRDPLAIGTNHGPRLGLRETWAERLITLEALANTRVDILTPGPLPAPHAPPAARAAPRAPGRVRRPGPAMAFGFTTVYAGPLVRSTFNAHEVAIAQGISIA